LGLILVHVVILGVNVVVVHYLLFGPPQGSNLIVSSLIVFQVSGPFVGQGLPVDHVDAIAHGSEVDTYQTEVGYT
jgi:hypothetical protein